MSTQATTTKNPEADAHIKDFVTDTDPQSLNAQETGSIGANKVDSPVQKVASKHSSPPEEVISTRKPEAEDADAHKKDSITVADPQSLKTQKVGGTNVTAEEDSHVAQETAASLKHSSPRDEIEQTLGKDSQKDMGLSESATEGVEASSGGRYSKFLNKIFRWRKNQSAPTRSDFGKTPTTGPPGSTDQVLNLITADYKYIEEGAAKLKEYNEQLDSALKEATSNFKELQNRKENVEDQRKLRKAMVKLKLQIPSSVHDVDADEADPFKKLKFTFKLAEVIPQEVLNVKPQLHKNDAFENGVEFKDFEARYNQLSNELKLCLMCFSIFPGNVTIKKRLMVQWWVCEGFAKDEKTANQNFIDLIKNGFIEPVNKNKSKSVAQCQMHPFYRSALAVIAERAKFFNFDDHGEPTQDFSQCCQSCLVGDGLISYDYLKNEFMRLEKLEGSQKKPAVDSLKKSLSLEKPKGSLKKSLSLEKPNGSLKKQEGSQKKPAVGNLKKPGSMEKQEGSQKTPAADSLVKPVENAALEKFLDDTLGKVHLLINVKETTLEFKYDWFSKMKNVNFVHLGSWRTTDHIEVDSTKFLEGVVPMDYLKFLSLQGVSNVIELPESIAQFQNLKFLDLRACPNLEKIPEKIGMLRNLLHLDMSECYLLNHMPKTLCELTELRVLKGFVVVTKGKGNCTLKDLNKLDKLEKLCIYTSLSGFPDDEDVKYFRNMTSLRKLTITWGGKVKQGGQQKQKNPPADTLKLPPNLEKLDLKCFPNSKTPNWLAIDTVRHLKSLKKLYIRGGEFSDLGQYQEADKLNLVQPKGGKNKYAWTTVEELRLKYLSGIHMEWGQLQELFPNLEYLEQVDCPKLAFFPCDANGVWTKKK